MHAVGPSREDHDPGIGAFDALLQEKAVEELRKGGGIGSDLGF